MESLLNKYLPTYDYREYHSITVNASNAKAYSATKQLDLKRSAITKTLLWLRGLPTNDLTLLGFLKNVCFVLIEEDPFTEFVIQASQPGLSIFWNFYFTAINSKQTLVSSETRILCLTKKSRFLFSIYWFFIKPFSGITRKEMLRLIKEDSEKVVLINPALGLYKR